MSADARERARALLSEARRARRRVALDEHAAAVDRLEAVLGDVPSGTDRVAMTWAVTAERLRDIGYIAEGEAELVEAATTAARGLAELDGSHPDVAARLHLAVAQSHARLHDGGWEEAAARNYRAAARRFIEAREPDDAAATLAALAWTVQLTSSTLRDARESLTEALSLARDDAMRASMLSQRAQVHTWLGDADAAQSDVETAWPMAQRGDDRSVAYVAWAAATVASMRGQRAVVEAWIEQGDRRRGSWAEDNVTGLWYESAMVDALARVGALDEARARLDALLPSSDREPYPVGTAQISVESRGGDVELAAAAWQRVRGRPDMEAWEAARLRLLLAAATEDVSGAAEAFELCAGFDEPAVLLTLEPEVSRAMLPAAAAAGSAVARRLLSTHLSWRLRVLGDFTLTSPDGEQVSPTGRARRLLAYLAVQGQPLGRRQVAAWLWPDRDDDAWRRARLRRLLHRVRSLAPGVVAALPGDRLGLGDRVTVDLDRFTRSVAAARVAQDSVVRVVRAREALGHLAGGLLPDEIVDDDWLDAARTRLARDATWLHLTIAEHEAAEGHLHVSVLHAREALAADPTNEAAAALAVDLLRRVGNRGQAQEVVRATTAALGEIGLAPGPRLAAAVARLRGTD